MTRSNMEKDQDKLLVMCDCHSHALYFESYKDDHSHDLFISLFERGTDGKAMNLSQRFRWIWHILIKGHPFTDMVTIDKDKVKNIQRYLKNNFGEI